MWVRGRFAPTTGERFLRSKGGPPSPLLADAPRGEEGVLRGFAPEEDGEVVFDLAHSTGRQDELAIACVRMCTTRERESQERPRSCAKASRTTPHSNNQKRAGEFVWRSPASLEKGSCSKQVANMSAERTSAHIYP